MQSHIQDIRGAIYDFKLRVESAESGTKKHEMLREVGLNYLVRYFFLITFANYYMEKRADSTGQVSSFSAWWSNRRELTNLVHRQNQDFE
jgi:hypothetical protein